MGPFFTFLATQSLERDILAALIGLCVGSFINVLALRTLAEKPFWTTLIGSSACPKCDHRLGPLDLVPVLSYLMLGRKCRYCKESISWSYPVVEIVTAITFVVVLYHFQVKAGNSFGSDDVVRAVVLDASMLVFLGILIAVCVTDFKEKLIPHEITYPSILIGIAFSAWARQDLMPTMAGIGVSYILFDFLAFYGLKMYYLMHKDEEGAKHLEQAVRAVDGDTLATVPVARLESQLLKHDLPANFKATEKVEQLPIFEEATVRSRMFAPAEDAVQESVIILSERDEVETRFEQPKLVEKAEPSGASLVEKTEVSGALSTKDITGDVVSLPNEADAYDPEIEEAFGLKSADASSVKADQEDEDFEVMGGGDAVLAALIAAWLGLENLGVTLVLGFMFGSLMGSGYLAHELYKLGTLHKALKSVGLIIALLLAISEGAIYMFASNTGMTAPGHETELRQLPWVALGVASIFGGILLGTILNGREGSKPFPFGPALAAGAVVAVFADPFHKMVVSEECIRMGTFLLDNMGHN